VTRRVLVARLDNAGDVLVSGPAIRAVAAGAEVTLLAGPAGVEAARMLPGVAEVLVWDCPWIANPAPAASPGNAAELTALLGGRDLDEAVVLTSFHQSPLPLALLLRLAGIRRITGASVDYAGSLLDVRLRPGEDLDEDLPEPERQLAIAAAAGYRLSAGDDGGLAVLPPADVTAIVPSEPYVVLHPGASVPSRRWPEASYAATVELLAERGIPAVVTGGPAETALTAAVAGAHGVDLGGRLSLPQLAGVLAGAAAVVVGNTGPAHLAAAVRTPVVSLYSPVVTAARWAPYRVPVALLGDQAAACRGTRARECPVAGHPCLTSVEPRQVVAACLDLAPRLGDREGVRL